MAERDYSHRGVVDKLGVKPGDPVVFLDLGWRLDDELRLGVLDRTGRDVADTDEPARVVLVAADVSTDAISVLSEWRSRIHPGGGIWFLTPKRGQPGYVDQTRLIVAGAHAGVVDNKVCSVSDTVSALRFVIRKADRPAAEARRSAQLKPRASLRPQMNSDVGRGSFRQRQPSSVGQRDHLYRVLRP